VLLISIVDNEEFDCEMQADLTKDELMAEILKGKGLSCIKVI